MRKITFGTSLDFIKNRIDKVDPVAYGRTRNFLDGDITYLSPYISRGAISTRQVFETTLKKGYAPKQIEKFIQELAWRDYWQQIWVAKGDAIDSDLKQPQPHAAFQGIPTSMVKGQTKIEAIDEAIAEFYATGYLHNHVRMYIASLATNIAKCHWYQPAQWMYYHLLDGDWASNALSWQWVAGANSTKKYYANQGNINKFCYSHQENTYLDVSYEELPTMVIPRALSELQAFELETPLPVAENPNIDPTLPTLIYNYYNLDPHWKSSLKANRILLLEPSHFKKYPISEKSITFMLDLSKNIDGIQVFVGEFQELCNLHTLKQILFKEHPTNAHYKGVKEDREWMFSVKGYYPSFFGFWKRCKKELKW